ncbi:MAG: YjhG/YagF family D-xylonate dehydratase [Opitutales bacterium]
MKTGDKSDESQLEISDESIFQIETQKGGPVGKIELTDEVLKHAPSGNLFGLSQNVGMGWSPKDFLGPQFLILNSHGGIRAEDGSPVALGYHTGHWEIGLLVKKAAEELKNLGGIPFAAHVSDPCDGRSQGTTAMFDSLAYRNDASLVMRRLARSLPTAEGVMGVATCDKSMPAMMMALAEMRDMPTILVPGGVTLSPSDGEDAGKAQSVGIRYAQGEIAKEKAEEILCRTCATPGGGCQFLGTAATSQVVGEALGLSLPHSALSPSGYPVWFELASRSAKALANLHRKKMGTSQILSTASIRNAMITHAACGGSSNLIIHLAAIAYHAGLERPTVKEWDEINRLVPRLVDVLPNGPNGYSTAQFFLAGGVPELMSKLKDLNLLELDTLTCTGNTLGKNLETWEKSHRRKRFRQMLWELDQVHPDDVIHSQEKAASKGMTSTLCFPTGNLAPEGSVIKSTAIDPSMLDQNGIYRQTGPAKVFTTEREAMRAVKGLGSKQVDPGDIIVLCGRGPLGAGMEEVAQVALALKHLSWGKQVALLTDARFSGVSTGACVGHISPEALANGPIGRIEDEDLIEIIIDTRLLSGSINFVGTEKKKLSPDQASEVLNSRSSNPQLGCDPRLHADTKLWAALQNVSGGTWGGCVFDTEKIIQTLKAGEEALAEKS